jgi:hypothetical protein
MNLNHDERTTLDNLYVVRFLGEHNLVLSPARAADFRPWPSASLHPLFGLLGPGITDGISVYAPVLRTDELVHVTLGQLDRLAPGAGAGTPSRTGAKRPVKTPKLDIENLF